MAKRKHTGTVVIAILVAILLAVGVSGWLFWQSVQRVIGEAQQAGEYAAEAQQSVEQGDFKQALEQMGSAGSHIVTARDETQGMPWQAAEYVPYYGSDVKAVRGMLGAAADAATNALPKIDSAAQGTLVDFNIEELLSGMNFSDGTLSIPKIASIKQDLSDAGVVLKRVKTSIYALPQPHTEQITEMVNQGKQVVDQIDEAFDTLTPSSRRFRADVGLFLSDVPFRPAQS